ncbi:MULTISPECIES: hypothetical protein [unclassified Roseobacter]|nr:MULTISPECIES: hypothetical protein [unclassified Roseobacter]MDW3184338.1 hypothetical protein [Roseobacter sp.]
MKKTVQGVAAPAPRMTKTTAFLIATGLSIPVFAILTLIDWLWL